MKAIETEYNGYRFRSRLEARWAVFFDAIGLDWRYEEQGYESNGVRYLPDFRLYNKGQPTDLFVEVKGDRFGIMHDDKYREVLNVGMTPNYENSYCDATKTWSQEAGIILLGDIPNPGQTHFHQLVQHFESAWVTWFCFVPPGFQWGGPLWIPDQYPAMIHGIATRKSDGEDIAIEHRSVATPYLSAVVDDAYRAARQARFEHGEAP